MVRALQERAARAFPAVDESRDGGWWLRHTTSPSWWLGATLPHDDGDLDRRVNAAEEFYAERRAVTRFQITPGVCAPALDPLLARRGYRRELSVELRTASTVDALGPANGVELSDAPGPAWFGVWRSRHGGDAEAERALLARVPAPSAYALAHRDGVPVAVGRCVAEDGWAGVFGMVTLPGEQGRGAGRAILAALAGWAAGRAATGMFLQVTADNAGARRLYERAGFTTAAVFHYRVGD
ncbi:acetyltransferase [Actinorhabdospora filicis]|uniref:Acetyltransferase n=1 Tax=Actinorhabdospora filicis TaxID=1785913 RepID=A0A9W6SVK5_9ACTN|nr:acetyltransferase [Actinorhabdospora filicis]